MNFNQQIVQAFKVKVESSNKRIGELEKDLKVKETELLYLTKKYDDDITALSSETKSVKENIHALKSRLEESNKNLSVKEDKFEKDRG